LSPLNYEKFWMFKDQISLLGELTEILDVYTEAGDFIDKGELKIRPRRSPVLELSNTFGTLNIDFKKFNVRTHNGTWYTLLGCTVYNFGRIYPEVIVKADSHSGEFQSIKFMIPGISQWLDSNQFSEPGSDYITKHLNKNKFSASLIDKDLGEVSISSDNWWSTRNSGSEFTVNQYTVISISSPNTYLSYRDAIQYIHRVKNLLSILMGYPLAIEYCFAGDGKGNTSIYFANAQEEAQEFDSNKEFLVWSSYLFSDNRWSSMFKNALELNLDNFLSIWSRLPGLSNFSKYWEYELLACVALADKYSAQFCSKIDERLSNGDFKRLLKSLKGQIDDYEVNENKDKLKKATLDSIKKQIGFLRNTKFESFQSCFECTYRSMSQEFIDIVDLTEDDFDHLKSLRNKIAHGDVPITKLDADINHEMKLQSKLLVILYFWAFKDFGFPERECIQFLANWLHPMIRSADLNKTLIDKSIGQYKFFPVGKRDFTSVLKTKVAPIVLEYIEGRKNYRLCKYLELKVKEWYADRSDVKPRSIDEYLTSQVNSNNIRSLCYIGSAYIENSDKSHRTRGICILNPPAEFIDKKRYWMFDEENKLWLQPLRDGE
jgi:hypothetical protein